MERTQMAGVYAAVLAGICLILMVTPWWGASGSNSGSFGGMSFNSSAGASAGPFDDGPGLIEGGKATIAGILILVSLLAAGAAAAILFVRAEKSRIAALLVGGSGFFVLFVAILAVTTWPPDGMGFWDSNSGSQGAITSQLSTYASFGWYAALVTGGFAAFVLMRVLGLEKPAPEPAKVMAPEEEAVATVSDPSSRSRAESKAASTVASGGQCTATTKAGSRCARKATVGAFCATHA